MKKNEKYDVLIIGGGAAGLMCAITAGKRGKKVCLLEHNQKLGAKILISGGGRCNFTNLRVHPECYISDNPHFARSALAGYTPQDFMALLSRHNITWHEKTLGQLFCDQKAGRVVDILTQECLHAGVDILTGTAVSGVTYGGGLYSLDIGKGRLVATSLVVASGGLSIPKLGATDFGYKIARQFGLEIIEPRPALVPFVFGEDDKQHMMGLAGVAEKVSVSKDKQRFRENLLFTHRGLSGPAILQISSYWNPGDMIEIDLLPDISDAFSWLKEMRTKRGKSGLTSILSQHLSKRLSLELAGQLTQGDVLGTLSNKSLSEIAERMKKWQLTPTSTEGFKKAEVTRGGVDTRSIQSKTMEARNQKGLFFIGECVDVTGWLGGYNFQWAWSSGWAAGNAV